MSLFFADLVREQSWGTGAGDLPLEGALPGHRRFADIVPPGARFHYAIAGATHPQEWEVGEGELTSGGALARLPAASSTNGDAVNFSAGLKTVALTVLADWFVEQEDAATGAELEALSEALAGKAALAHDHAIAEVNGLTSALAGKAAAGHGHGIGDVTGLGPALDGKAALAGAAFTGAVTAPSLSLSNDLAVADGGTGASSAPAARNNLGLGTIATQSASNVDISGGTITGISSLIAAGLVDIASDASGYLRIGRFGAGQPAFIQPGASATSLTLQAPGGASILAVNAAGASVSGALGVTGAFSAAGGSIGGDLAANNFFGPDGGFTIGSPDAQNGMQIFGAWDSVTVLTGGATRATFNSSGIALGSGLTISIDGQQVMAARRTGWTSPSGTATRSSFDTATVTTEALAARVKALVDDLVAHGLIGS